jgi:hypothetical protein
MRCYVCFYVTSASLQQAQKAGCDAIVYYGNTEKINCAPLTAINANDFDRAAFEWSFTNTKKRLQQWAEKCPAFFTYNGIPLLDALNKDFFWANRIENMLAYACKQLPGNNHTFVYEPRVSSVKLQAAAYYKIRKHWWNHRFMNEPAPVHIHNTARIGFAVNANEHLVYYKTLLETITDEPYAFFSNWLHHGHVKMRDIPGVSDFRKGYRVMPNRFSLGDIRKGGKWFSAAELYKLIAIRSELVNAIHVNEANFASGSLKALFLLAQENTGYGIITALQARAKGITTFNSHNGTKNKDPHNRDNVFDCWCVWDEQMKTMLHTHCGIAAEQLQVTGHLKQDLVSGYVYSGAFDVFLKDAPAGSKVISFYSVHADFSYRYRVAETLMELVQQHPDHYLIIRLHPAERRSDWAFLEKAAPERVLLTHPADDNGVNRLYDQLRISDLTVTLGSTVTIESRWFGVPAITYEEREQSIVYAVDDKTIFHISRLDELKSKAVQLLQQGKTGGQEGSDSPVAKKMLQLVYERIGRP